LSPVALTDCSTLAMSPRTIAVILMLKRLIVSLRRRKAPPRRPKALMHRIHRCHDTQPKAALLISLCYEWVYQCIKGPLLVLPQNHSRL
jgi:hypothetical protein